MARRLDDVDDVALQLGRDVDAAELVRSTRATVSASVTGSSSSGAIALVALRVEDRELGVAVGIADAQAQQEAVELRFGQGIGAFELDRVLRRDHHERRRQRVGLRVDA